MEKSELIILIIAVALFAALLAWLLTRLTAVAGLKKKLSESELSKESIRSDLFAAEKNLAAREEALKARDAILAEKKENYERSIAELKETHEKTLEQQIAALKAEMTAQTEKILKEREEELSKKARETFESISGNLGKDLKDMKDAFEANKKTHNETSASLKEKFDNAVKNLEQQSRSIGEKADHLAEALRGQKKFQGVWGETILLNLLTTEGLVEGRDFEKEATLRDELGFVIVNEDSDKKMRPDFILHYPEGQDIVVDAKVSLNAFSDYVEANTDEERKDAAERNAAAIKEQVKNLSRKDYSRYLRPGHKMLDYVVMFVPNYPALQLAYSIDANIWKSAYSQGVLITTEETLMPFLRMITIAWTNVEQVRNQQQIIEAAQQMVDRVADFSKAHADMGKKLEEAVKCYDQCSDKLKDSGRSIVQSAKKVIKLGVPSNPKKPLPES